MTKIAATLIVKNSEATIEQCLASIRPFVDYVCVYDTGSTDKTLKILHELDEQREFPIDVTPLDAEDHVERMVPLAPILLREGEWRDDFSWAREQSFAMVPGDADWVIWLDDDDLIQGAEWLRQLAATADAAIDGFVLQYDYARDERGNTICVLWRERLMRRSAGYTWRNAVHEVLIPPEGKPANLVMVPPEQIRYVHNRPPDRYAPDRNLRILLAEKERQEANGKQPDPRTTAYLGTELMAAGRFAEAIPYLEQYITHPEAGWSDERMQVHHKLATCLRLIGNPHAAVHVESEAMKERIDWAETYVGLCESYTMLQQWDRVEHYATLALQKGMPQSMLILNPLEFSFVPFVRLAEACIATNRAAEALVWIERAQQVAPEHPLLLERRAMYERAQFESTLVAATLTLREAAVRHDENVKALQILENAPYVIADHPMIVKARSDQREMCKHYLHAEEYTRWYSDEPKESTLTDEHIDLVGDWFGRVGGLLKGLREQEAELGRPPRLLDLGCNDFWMGEFFWRNGIPCDGVELNRKSYELAIERKERFGRTDAVIVHGDLHDAPGLLGYDHPTLVDGGYDAVSLFEVLEHVPDIDKTLALCESLIRPGGRVYISTPNGAFEQGNLPNWHVVMRKGHLRAIPMHQLAELLNERGEINELEHTNGDRVAFAAYTPTKKKGKIVFYAGGSWEPWSPMSVIEGGLGGSETALVRLSACLGRLGYEVKVYAETESGNAITAGGVIWRPHTAWDPTEEADLLVVSRMAHVFDNPAFGAKNTALWCHDHSYPGQLTEARAERIDHIVTLSDWQRERFARLYPFAADKLVVRRNGITYTDPAGGGTAYPFAQRPFPERTPRCVYSSSADRGLDVLLEMWPRIRAEVPDAELHVFYGWDVFDRVALQNPSLHAYKMRVLELAHQAGGEEGGIFMRGRVGQRELAEEMQQARVWSYPTAFLETSCIGAMEARAAGLPIVTSDLAALSETVGEHGICIPWYAEEDEPYNQTDDYAEAFIEDVVSLLTIEDVWTAWHREALRGVKGFDWSLRAKEWAKLTAPTRSTKRRAKPVAA
jgi:glycosyltransferase involved in cell wall biosynthesis/SAM-dependent methyltransferase